MQLGLSYHQAGHLSQAEAIYRQVLEHNPRHADALHLLGMIALQTGQLLTAEELIRCAIKIAPQSALFYDSLGRVLMVRGKPKEASQAYRAAIELSPQLFSSYNDLGVAMLAQGELAEAKACFQRALERNPLNPEAHYNLGTVLLELRRYDEAIASLREAITLKPEYAEAHNNLGNALAAKGQTEQAIVCYRKAISLKPDYADAYNNLGCALSAQGLWEEATASCREALRLKPDYAEAYNNLGNALKSQGRYEEASACYREVLRLRPDDAEVLNNLGIALVAQNCLDEAETCYQEALRLRPDYAAAHCNLGNLLVKQNRLREAVACYERALTLNPNMAVAHLNLAFTLLVQGDFRRGLAEFEWRWKTTMMEAPSFAQPRWDGSLLAGGAILLYEEQGLGDTIQFIRYAALVKERCGDKDCTVIVRCQSSLARLLARCDGVDRIVMPGDELPDFETHAPLMSLPLLLGTTLEQIPNRVPYLRADPALAQQWRERLQGAAFKVGICWQGNPKHQNDRNRSFPLACFAPLAALGGLQLISLQKGAGSEQLDQIDSALRERITVLAELNGPEWDLMDTAAVLVNLDLVITPDTALAHLAGALGLRVWTALPFSPDWRWLLEREDSPWYPTMRLFRQRQPARWDEVFTRMCDELRKLR